MYRQGNGIRERAVHKNSEVNINKEQGRSAVTHGTGHNNADILASNGCHHRGFNYFTWLMDKPLAGLHIMATP